ncbi:MAG: hypothetical protein NUV80_05115 [Candidatus Berkelbacteria bacterium]|nr:hypothetical protein [Candidatus Berkelbacteria bacterium]MCR4307917.1 hypothetical protein [Candidatus Berkelbacteria bacterium]
MRLPVPNENEVKRFRELCQQKFGVELSDEEAQRYATKIVQLFYVQHYGIHPLCPPVERDPLDKSEL